LQELYENILLLKIVTEEVLDNKNKAKLLLNIFFLKIADLIKEDVLL
jgi:hypothetical protein